MEPLNASGCPGQPGSPVWRGQVKPVLLGPLRPLTTSVPRQNAPHSFLMIPQAAQHWLCTGPCPMHHRPTGSHVAHRDTYDAAKPIQSTCLKCGWRALTKLLATRGQVNSLGGAEPQRPDPTYGRLIRAPWHPCANISSILADTLNTAFFTNWPLLRENSTRNRLSFGARMSLLCQP